MNIDLSELTLGQQAELAERLKTAPERLQQAKADDAKERQFLENRALCEQLGPQVEAQFSQFWQSRVALEKDFTGWIEQGERLVTRYAETKQQADKLFAFWQEWAAAGMLGGLIKPPFAATSQQEQKEIVVKEEIKQRTGSYYLMFDVVTPLRSFLRRIGGI